MIQFQVKYVNATLGGWITTGTYNTRQSAIKMVKSLAKKGFYAILVPVVK